MLKVLDILSKTEIMENTDPSSILISILSVVVPGSLIISFIVFKVLLLKIAKCDSVASNEKSKQINFYNGIVGVVTTVGIVVMYTIVCFNAKEVHTGRYEYKVYVNDKETASSIYENYDVIDIEGNVWTIQDKETNNQRPANTDKIN